MESLPNNEISELLKQEGNNHCIDCQLVNPTYTSINNAVFLCDNCADIHKRLGQNITQIKSITNDQFSDEEISLLKIGGNLRLENLLKEYSLKEDQNKQYKYYLKIVEYYRSLLKAELNKENNITEYEELINNKPSLEVGLQIMEPIISENLKQINQPEKSEFSKDVSKITGKIGGFFSFIGQKINDTAKKIGLTQKIDETRTKINEGVKTFGENHPKIQNAATKTKNALGTAKTFTANTLNKIMESKAIKTISTGINKKYSDVINSETMNNISKKAEEEYISFKLKTGMKLNNEDINNINSVPANDNQENNEEEKESLINNKDESKESNDNIEEQKEQKDNNDNNEEVKEESKDNNVENKEQSLDNDQGDKKEE